MFEKKHDYLICVDVDGTLIDNMELKHKECFCPQTVNVWNLQPVSRYAREAAEYVNLYSRSRGTNRFPALVETVELLAERPEVVARKVSLPDMTPLKEWIAETKSLSEKGLREYLAEREVKDPILQQAVAWSAEVNLSFEKIVRNIVPFPGVRETLEKASEFADVTVVSATPEGDLKRELEECGITHLICGIYGQESGPKAACIREAMAHGYTPEKTLMVGDAPGDSKAAAANDCLFFPIIPASEDASWEELLTVGLDKFHENVFSGAYMETWMSAFMERLSITPPWKQ